MSERILRKLWQGWFVIDDARSQKYIFCSPCSTRIWAVWRKPVDRLVQKGYVMRRSRQGLELTEEGLKKIGCEAALTAGRLIS